MNVYKLIIAYNGSFFKGWQTQGTNPNTAQEFLTENLKDALRITDLHLYGASRTDALVNASYQVVKLEIDKEIDPIKVMRGFNQSWGEKLKILSLEKVTPVFNPLKGIEYKEYHYSFSINEPHPLHSGHIFYQRQNIDFKLMQAACEIIEGTHDFTYLSVKGSGSENRIRCVELCELEVFKNSFGEEVYIIKFQASGFLKYMIRMIVDALFRVGTGELKLAQLKTQLTGVKEFEPKKAKPFGLNLFYISYK
jgi:tRNA pseudouridine38-40 synthase